jgi:Uma2 family endonuclease
MQLARSSTIQPASSEKLFTIADLDVFPEDLPSGPARYELHNGRLIARTLQGYTEGSVNTVLMVELKIQGEDRGHGKARATVGVVLRRNPDSLFCPRAAYIANSSLPKRRSPEGYLETIPDIVLETRGIRDRSNWISEKVPVYLKAGVRVVWVADPKKQTITAYRPKRKPKVFTAKDTLTVEDVIPGFQFPVADVFRD